MMSARRWSAFAAFVSVTLVLAACSADPQEDQAPTPESSATDSVSDPNPAERVSVLVDSADLIVRGTIESVDAPVANADDEEFPAQQAVVTVSEVLKGDAQSSITVVKPEGTWYYLSEYPEASYDAKHEGVFVLKAAGDAYDLFGYVGVHDDLGAWQKFDRVLAGLSEDALGATEEQLAAWTAQADIIVFASAQGTEAGIAVHAPRVDFSTTATLTAIEVLKGEMPEPLDVVRGEQPDVPGGTWWFPVKDEGQVGVYFIDTSSGTPTVINTTQPSEVNDRQVPLG